MARQSTADNLADLVRLFGGEVSGGETTAQLIDQLERVAPQGGGTPSQEAMAQAVEQYLETHTGGLTDEEINELFNG